MITVALMFTIDNMQHQMSMEQRDGEPKNQKEMLAIKKKKKTGAGIKNAFDRHISRLDMTKETINELEGMSIKIPKLKSQENKG